nr:MAG TPA: hypothetical protein [Caudoviricetes sp.]
MREIGNSFSCDTLHVRIYESEEDQLFLEILIGCENRQRNLYGYIVDFIFNIIFCSFFVFFIRTFTNFCSILNNWKTERIPCFFSLLFYFISHFLLYNDINLALAPHEYSCFLKVTFSQPFTGIVKV